MKTTSNILDALELPVGKYLEWKFGLITREVDRTEEDQWIISDTSSGWYQAVVDRKTIEGLADGSITLRDLTFEGIKDMKKKTHIVGKTRPVLKEDDSVRSAKDIIRATRRAKSGIPDLNIGDKVRITLAGMQKHSRSTPASSGYSASTIAWREKLSKFRTDGTVGTVTKVFPNSDNVNVDFNGETFGVYDYMLELVPGDGMKEVKQAKLQLMKLYEKFETQVGQQYDMSKSEKAAFLEAIRNYEAYGNLIYRAEGIAQAIDEISQLVETANTFTLKETDGWFDNVTATRHTKQMKEAVKILQTEAKEIMQRQQRLEAAYEDIGQLLGRYYNV